MPRRFIRRFIPSDETLKSHKALGIFGKLILAPNLWHLNRRSFSGAFLVGLFCAYLPIPFQMVVAAAGALILRVNLPVSVALVWLTNPITMPPAFYFAYRVGAWILHTPKMNYEFQLNYNWIMSELSEIWKPLLLGSLICGAVLSVIGYVSARVFWRWWVIRSWKKRQQRNVQ